MPYLPVWPTIISGGAKPKHRQGKPCVPKKEGAINPINQRSELTGLLCPKQGVLPIPSGLSYQTFF